MASVHLLIFGFVQGVGYRKFVKKEAEKRNLTGWVRNLPAGRQGLPSSTVEAAISGDKEKIEEVIELCKKGPFLSEVENIEVSWDEKPMEYQGFMIRHDLE